MKIVMLANARAVHTQRWARALTERGHQVTVISIRGADIPGVTVLRRSLGNVDRSKAAALLSYLLLLFRLPFDLRRLKPDVVNPHYCITHGVIAALTGAHPRVVNVWGSDLIWKDGEKPLLLRKALIQLSLKGADAIISTSKFMADAIDEVLPGHPPVSLVPFGVDTARFVPAENKSDDTPLRIGFIKSFANKYAPEIFVEAAALAAKGCPDLEFIMAGRGPLRDEIEKLASERGLKTKIHFPGFIPNEKVPALLGQLDILVNCSRSESFGVVICEASSCGLPVIATDVGGVRETLIENETGLFVPCDDPQSLATAILKLSADTELRKRMGAAGRSFIAEVYEWEQCVDKMEETLHQASQHAKKDAAYTVSKPSAGNSGILDS